MIAATVFEVIGRMVLLLDVVRATALEVDPSRAGDVEPHPQGADRGLEGGGGIGLRLAGGVERGDLREDGLQADGRVDGHRSLEGDRPTSEGEVVGVWVVCVGHGGRLGEVPAEDGDLGAGVRAGVAILDDLVIAGADFGLGLGRDILIEVAGGRLACEDDDLASGVVDAVEGIRADAADVACLLYTSDAADE